MTTRRRFLTVTTAAIAAPVISRGAFAQSAWPAAKPIRAICPFTAGSTIDILGRIVTDPLSQALGQTIVVENRGGAGGSIGSAAVAKSEADGYTLLINAAAHTAAPAAYPNITYYFRFHGPIIGKQVTQNVGRNAADVLAQFVALCGKLDNPQESVVTSAPAEKSTG